MHGAQSNERIFYISMKSTLEPASGSEFTQRVSQNRLNENRNRNMSISVVQFSVLNWRTNEQIALYISLLLTA